MKYLISTLAILITFSCKSQIISLEDAAQCYNNPNCPDYNYKKDINNSLDKYIGAWQGTYDGKIYELNLKKGLYEDMGRKSDDLKGRLRITTQSQNITVFDNFNELNDEKTNFSGLGFIPNLKSYEMYFSGPTPQGCINYGSLFLTIKPNNLNEMTIMYWSDKDIVIGDCPSSFSQTFPEKKSITLTKQ